MEDRTRDLRDRLELVLLFLTGGISVTISVLDLTGSLDAKSWVALRIPALTLLSVGFIATYLILERRGMIEKIATMLDQRSLAILQTVGVEIEKYPSSGDWAYAIAARIRKAQRVHDVSWTPAKEVQHRWSSQDRAAHEYCDLVLNEVIRKPDVIWQEIFIFFPGELHYFEIEKKNILDPNTVGYSLAYFNVPSPEAPPRLGGFTIVDRGTDEAEVFLSSADSTIWLRAKHPLVVDYFGNYFDQLWHSAEKLKVGVDVDRQRLEQLEAELLRRSKSGP